VAVVSAVADWRYCAHVHPAEDPDHDEFTVEVVTDLDWKLVGCFSLIK
jgi:hypothetical protein